MKTVLVGVCCLVTAQIVCAATTIDRLTLGDLSAYPAQNPSTYTPFQLMYPENVTGHYTSDGAFWEKGAGIGQIIYATYQGVTASSGMLYYHFAPRADGVLISYTDYGFGGNFSTQGTLGYSGDLIFVTQQGSTVARCIGATSILDNSPTGSAQFHNYSASVGQSVYFEMAMTIRNATWQPNTFQGNFSFNGTGFVDFTQMVPEPSIAALFCLGGGCLIFFKRARTRS
jgi:hypothetical protein